MKKIPSDVFNFVICKYVDDKTLNNIFDADLGYKFRTNYIIRILVYKIEYLRKMGCRIGCKERFYSIMTKRSKKYLQCVDDNLYLARCYYDQMMELFKKTGK
jgi:hypothetical protein